MSSKPRPQRVQVSATLDPTVHAVIAARAVSSGVPYSRVLDAAARRGLGLPDQPPPLPPNVETND